MMKNGVTHFAGVPLLHPAMHDTSVVRTPLFQPTSKAPRPEDRGAYFIRWLRGEERRESPPAIVLTIPEDRRSCVDDRTECWMRSAGSTLGC